jgi:hypothetical protein
MIHHVSFAARDPKGAAEAIAALWGGEAFPFPPVAEGSWLAIAGDDRGTTIEVYPAGAELQPTEGPADAVAVMNPQPRQYVATHAAIASPLSAEAVQAMAAERGWTTKYCKRGGRFGVIELWVENSFLLEVMTPEMQREYTDFMSPQTWQAMLAAGRPGAA